MYRHALQIAYKAHQGQVRNNSNVPYIVHPIRVANTFSDYQRKTIAVLHDVVEDTDIEFIDLMKEFPSKVLLAIDALTKRHVESYFEYIERLSKNELAVDIKIADVIDNLSDTPTESMIKRYNKTLEILTQIKWNQNK